MHEHEPASDATVVSVRAMDIATALALMALAIIVMLECVEIGFGWSEAEGPQAGFFPFIVCAALAFASLINALQAALFPTEDQHGDFVSIPGLGRVALVVAPLAAYIFAIGYVGIYVASALFIAIFMMAFGKIPLVKSLAVGVGVPLALFFMFERWFLVPLPKGPLEAMLGY
ncbi:MAG: tripartite tricarboxylate transporter TctB family protein [Alphaproteobacteria bacterium]|nr:tripartite tricarboxylate transporter TctB family protein [Alphaproteobacteria bacterium]